MLQVENVTRNTILVTRGQVAGNFWTRFRGLMGVRQLPIGDGLLIKHCDSVHTHFMRMTIDVLYVNVHNCIVGMDAAMQPWRIGRKWTDAAYVLELPNGTITRSQSAIGDQLKVSTE